MQTVMAWEVDEIEHQRDGTYHRSYFSLIPRYNDREGRLTRTSEAVIVEIPDDTEIIEFYQNEPSVYFSGSGESYDFQQGIQNGWAKVVSRL